MRFSLSLDSSVHAEFPARPLLCSISCRFSYSFSLTHMRAPFLILVVDDDPLLLDILNRASRNSFPEASFRQLTSCTEAIRYIHELDGYGPKLVLLDIHLNSSQSGFTFLTFLKNHTQARSLPVIVLTLDDAHETVETAYEALTASFTVKPDSFEGWKQYFVLLRQYWFEMVTVPSVRFHKRTTEQRGKLMAES
jgi:DNA-binding NarL/FixJ family response regulator